MGIHRGTLEMRIMMGTQAWRPCHDGSHARGGKSKNEAFYGPWEERPALLLSLQFLAQSTRGQLPTASVCRWPREYIVK